MVKHPVSIHKKDLQSHRGVSQLGCSWDSKKGRWFQMALIPSFYGWQWPEGPLHPSASRGVLLTLGGTYLGHEAWFLLLQPLYQLHQEGYLSEGQEA